MKLCMTAWFFGKSFFAPKIGEMGQKQGFLNLKKNLIIIFHWICSILKIFTISCVMHKFFFWERSCSWDIGQNALSQSNCRIFNKVFLQSKLMKQPHFKQVHKNSQNLKFENFLISHAQKLVWSIWSLDSKIDSVSRMNQWN